MGTRELVLLASRRNETTQGWWEAVKADADAAPAPIRALLERDEPVKVPREEADEAFIWAIQRPGWTIPQPIYVSGVAD